MTDVSEDQKWVLIIGGCSEQAQKAAKKCIDDGYLVVVVDDVDENDINHPSRWLPEYFCNDNRRFVYYQDNILNFLTTTSFLSGIKWFMVMNYAHITDPDYVIECTTNNIITATFVRWVHFLPAPKPQVITPYDTIIGQYFSQNKHLWCT